MKTMAMMMTTTMTLRGWQLASTGSCKAYCGPMFLHRLRRLRKGRKAETVTGAKRRRRLAVHGPTWPLPPPKVGLFFYHDPLKRQAQAVESKPRQRGR
jgi:hypothetical protein